MMSDWSTRLDDILTVLAFIGTYGVLLLIAKWFKDLLTPYKLMVELVKKDNFAIGISMGGYFLATAIIFVGVLLGPSAGLVPDLIAVGGYSLLGLVFLNSSRWCLDKLVFNKFCNIASIVEDQNCGMAAVRFGVYVATGLIAAGSLNGEGGGVVVAVAFFVLGQVCLVAFSRLYDLITPFDLQQEIEDGNVAAGIAFGGTIIAMGIIIMNAAAGDFLSWNHNLVRFVELALPGIVILPVVRYLMDKLVITGEDLNREIAVDRNMAAGFLEMSVMVCFATVLAALI